jgi:hypothetical protein
MNGMLTCRHSRITHSVDKVMSLIETGIWEVRRVTNLAQLLIPRQPTSESEGDRKGKELRITNM